MYHDIPGTDLPHGTQDNSFGTEYPYGTQCILQGAQDIPFMFLLIYRCLYRDTLATNVDLSGFLLLKC